MRDLALTYVAPVSKVLEIEHNGVVLIVTNVHMHVAHNGAGDHATVGLQADHIFSALPAAAALVQHVDVVKAFLAADILWGDVRAVRLDITSCLCFNHVLGLFDYRLVLLFLIFS